MKRVLSILLTAALILSVAVISAGQFTAATIIQCDDFYYEKVADGSTYAANVSSYVGSNKNVIIPKTMHGWNVTGIASNFMKDNTTVETVSLPLTVKTIGSLAFYKSTALKRITIPEYVSEIGIYAFQGCTSLKSFTIESTVLKTIPNGCFNNCTALEEVIIPSGVFTISNYAFGNCTAVTNIEIADSVTTIGEYAFVNCTGTKTIKIGEGMTNLDFLLNPNTKLSVLGTNFESITIGSNVTSIPDSLFDACADTAVIYGYKDSYAKTYAAEKGITFIALDEEPITTEEPTTEQPTTEEPTTEQPTTDVPATTEEPSTAEPDTTEEPTTDEPATTEEPTTDAPNTTNPVTTYIFGDANGDGTVNIKDATYLQRYLAGFESLSDTQLKISDVNGDGTVNIKDVTVIQRYLAGLPAPAGIGEPIVID